MEYLKKKSMPCYHLYRFMYVNICINKTSFIVIDLSYTLYTQIKYNIQKYPSFSMNDIEASLLNKGDEH